MITRDYMSFGGGVQSTAIAMLCLERDPRLLKASDGRVPEVFVFADTGDEPASVYQHVRHMSWRLASFGSIFATVTAGRLSEHVLERAEAGKRGISFPPMYVAMKNEPREVPIRRGCTYDFKVKPLDKWARAHFGITRKTKKGPVFVRQWFGISADEATRMRTSNEGWRENFYPLVEMGWKRSHCVEYLAEHGIVAPRSACSFCPFHTDVEWSRLKREEPAEFTKAVGFERKLHAAMETHGHLGGLESKPYLHRSRVPLDSVDFEGGNLVFSWDNECAGVCGV